MYTKFIDSYQCPKIIGYIHFNAPIKKDMLATINTNIRWTDQRFSNSACMRYIEKINAEEHGELVTRGTHWPIKAYTQTPQQINDVQQPELKKKTPTTLMKTHTYQQQPWHQLPDWSQQTL